MKKIKLLTLFSVLVLTACGASSESSTDTSSISEITSSSFDYQKPNRDLATAGTAVYVDRAIERRQYHRMHEDKLDDIDKEGRQKYVDAMNEEYGKDYYETFLKSDGTLGWRFTSEGRKYFNGMKIDEVSEWLSTNPYGLSTSEAENEINSFVNGNRSIKISYQQQAIMNQYVSLSEMDKWIKNSNRSLADWNADFLGGNYVSKGKATDYYWEERDRLVEVTKSRFNSYLTGDEKEVYNFTSDVSFESDFIVYNYNKDYVVSISREFTASDPTGGEDFEGTLYFVLNIEDNTPEVVDRIAVFD